MKIFYHHVFTKNYKRLPLKIKLKAERRELLFCKDPFDPRLKTHKLHGKLKDTWSFSVDNTFRILFEFTDSCVIFLDIGDHDLYK